MLTWYNAAVSNISRLSLRQIEKEERPMFFSPGTNKVLNSSLAFSPLNVTNPIQHSNIHKKPRIPELYFAVHFII